MTAPLCASVAIQPDEHLSSLLVRTAALNVAAEVRDLTQHVGITSRKTCYAALRHQGKLSEIAQLLQRDQSALAGLFHPRVEGRMVETVDWFGTPLERRFIEVERRRFSPRGIADMAYGRSVWMIRPLHFCPQYFDILVEDCLACGAKQGWTRGVELNKCQACEASLLRVSRQIPRTFHDAATLIGRLLSHDQRERNAVVSKLPQPFCSWEAGDVFTAVVELGAAAVNADTNTSKPLGKKMGWGDFSCLGPKGVFEGWSIVCGWPETFSALIRRLVSRRVSDGGGWKSCLGLLSRNLVAAAPDNPFRNLIREAVPIALRDAQTPFKRLPGSWILGASRANAMTTVEAEEELNIDRGTLKVLAGQAQCFLGQYPGRAGVRLFDREKLLDCIAVFRREERLGSFARRSGVPRYCAHALLESGLLTQLDHADAQILAGDDPLLNRDSVKALEAPEFETGLCEFEEVVPLSMLLQTELNPAVWVSIFRAFQKGEIKAWPLANAANLVCSIAVMRRDFWRVTRRARLQEIPDIRISALAAKPLMGVSDGFLWAAARGGLISFGDSRLDLRSLAQFQKKYMLPSEIAAWRVLGGKEFRRIITDNEIVPAAVFLRTRVWLRDEMERLFPESIRMEF